MMEGVTLFSMPWNPEHYQKLKSQRSTPFFDLIKLVEIRPTIKVIDLGCGTGELTRFLADSLPGSDVLGLDSSSEMLDKTASCARPGLRFELGDQSQLTGEWDLIFSNAALQWSEDHEKLIPDLFKRLNQNGQLAVQVPSNHHHISHKLIRDLASEEPYRKILRGFNRQSPVLPMDQYAQILFNCGAEEIIVFEKIYPHVLEDSDAVVEWVSGTALVPYFERLGEHKNEFLNVLQKRMHLVMPESPVFYPFRRTFISARKPR
jgi:trans-aconitate 2-methyltransferase